jgi:hypothetical protein
MQKKYGWERMSGSSFVHERGDLRTDANIERTEARAPENPWPHSISMTVRVRSTRSTSGCEA